MYQKHWSTFTYYYNSRHDFS